MPRKSKGKFKPQRINGMSNYGDAEIFRNSAAVLDDVDPCESLRYMKEIFKDKFDEDVIAMIFSECAYDVNQAYETLISLSSEDERKQEPEVCPQVPDAASKEDNSSINADQAAFLSTSGKSDSHPVGDRCGSDNSKPKAGSSLVTVAHGGQTYYLHQHTEDKGQTSANSIMHPDGPTWLSSMFYTPYGNSYPPPENVCTDSISASSFSRPSPQFITPFLPAPGYGFGSPSPKGPGLFESPERNRMPFGYSKVASKGIFKAPNNNFSPKRTSSPSSKKNRRNDESAILSAIEKIQNGHLVMVILRGLPGSGKSTLAKRLRFSGVLFSTDDFFYNRGKYVFDATKLSEAHAWNRKRTLKALQKGITPIIIDNTNVEAWEFAPYVAMGKRHQYDVLILEPNTPWKFKVHDLSIRNKHGVPKEKIAHMKERYQHNVTVENVMKSIEYSNLQTEELVENQFPFSKNKKNGERQGNTFPSEVLVHHSQELPDALLKSDFMADPTTVVGETTLANISGNPKSSFVPEGYASNKILKDDAKSADADNGGKCLPLKESNLNVPEEREGKVGDENESNDDETSPSSISNLDELRALVREDSEDSQSQSASNLDISSWNSITELDDEFQWSAETDNLENGENVSEITTIPEEPDINDLSESVQSKPREKSEDKDMNVSIKNFSLESIKNNMVMVDSQMPKNISKAPSEKRYPLFNFKAKNTNQDQAVDKNSTERQRCVKNFKLFSGEINNQLLKLNISDSEDDGEDIPEKQFSGNVIRLRNYKNRANTTSLDDEKFCEKDSCLEFEKSNKRSLSLGQLDLSKNSNNISCFNLSIDDPSETNESILKSWEEVEKEDANGSNTLDINGNNSSPSKNDLHSTVQSERKTPKPQRGNHNFQFNFRKKFEALNPLKIDDSVSWESNSSWENIEVKELNKEIEIQGERHFTPKPPRNMDVSKNEKKITNSESSFNSDSSSEKPLKNRLCANFNQSFNLSQNEWQFPEYVWGDVDPLECEKESSIAQKLSCSSQTEPKDFVMVHKVGVGEPVSEDYVLLEAKIECDGDGGTRIESLVQQEIVVQNPTFEKSTYTEDLLEDIEVNQKMAHLQECFPDIEEEDLHHLLEICHNDDAWLSNLLLEWGYKYNVKTPVQTPQKKKRDAMESNENRIGMDITDEVISVEAPAAEVAPAADERAVTESASENSAKHASFEKLSFVLDPVFAAQLENIFGPVKKQSQKNGPSASDRVVEIDLHFAELIYNQWKETLSSERTQPCDGMQNPLGSTPAISLKGHNMDVVMREKDIREPFAFKENISEPFFVKERDVNEPLPLSEIMDMEYALQIHKKEKLQRDTDFSTKLKRLELYDLFPGADPLALDEIFEHNNFNLKDTVIALDEDIGEPKKEVQDKKIKKMDECLEKWRQNDVFREFALGDWSDWVFKENSLESMEEIAFPSTPPSMPPEAAELREIATHHYHQRQECIKKAQAAYCKGMKDVASFYAQQGDEHGQKLKEANKRASEIISKQRSNASPLVLDLHGLFVQEAIPALEKFLRDRKLELRRRQQSAPQIVSVITGQGIHSMRGPKILPSVITFLEKAGYGYNEINRGMLEITLIPD